MIRAHQNIESENNATPDSHLSSGPELTPLIDIVFIVVVFLLLTANTRLLSMPVNIPDADSKVSSSNIESSRLTIAIGSEAPFWQMQWDETPSSGVTPIETFNNWEELKPALLKATRDEPSIVIAPDAMADAERLVQLLALLNEHNLTDAHILMEPK